MITLWRSEFASKLKKPLEEIEEVLNERVLEQVLEALSDGKIETGDAKSILWAIAGEGKKISEALVIEKVDSDALESSIREILLEKPGLRQNAYMGLVIKKLGANVDKRKTMEILNKLIKS